MSVFVIPKTFCNKICSLIAKFWWRSSGKERGIHWTKWSQLKKTKMQGGMGFRDLNAMNIALVAKQVWRVQNNPDALWAKVLKSLYFTNSSIWDAKKGRKASWGWVSMLKGRDFINKHKAWHIKDGSKVRVCGDRWLHCGDRIWMHDNIIQDSVVSVLLTEESAGEGWDLSKLDHFLPRDVARKVLATPIYSHLSEDTAYWP